jgi:hypothetical protein
VERIRQCYGRPPKQLDFARSWLASSRLSAQQRVEQAVAIDLDALRRDLFGQCRWLW